MPFQLDHRFWILDFRKKSIIYNLSSKIRCPRRQGFTLIELLVVITIIAVLGSFSFAAFDNARQKGRDQRRKEDLAALRTALTAYYLDAAQYVSASSGFSSDQGENWIAGLSPDYIKKLPQDPLPANTSGVTPMPTLSSTFGADSSDTYLIYTCVGCYHPLLYPAMATCSVGTQGNYHHSFVGQWATLTTYRTNRSFLRFYTSGIPDDATITGAALQLYITGNSTTQDFNLKVQSFGWGSSVDCPDYSGTSTNVGTISTSNLVFIQGYKTFNLLSSAINKNGPNSFRLVSDREDPLPGQTPTDGNDEYFSYAQAETPGKYPKLQVWYQEAPPADYQCQNKKNVYCYAASSDGTSFVLWAQLENSKDKEAIGNSDAVCRQTPPSADYNFCLEAPK